jgi:hypothetical protein
MHSRALSFDAWNCVNSNSFPASDPGVDFSAMATESRPLESFDSIAVNAPRQQPMLNLWNLRMAFLTDSQPMESSDGIPDRFSSFGIF